jgi:hypothetical protein
MRQGPLGEDNDAEIVMTGLVPVIHVVELPETPAIGFTDRLPSIVRHIGSL